MNKNKGITLIALVITMIIMLILIAVTINLAIDGGLLNYAKHGASETEIAKDKDLISSALGSWGVEKYTGTKTLREVLNNEFGAENVNETDYGVEVTMPSGKTYIISDDGIISEKVRNIFK